MHTILYVPSTEAWTFGNLLVVAAVTVVRAGQSKSSLILRRRWRGGSTENLSDRSCRQLPSLYADTCILQFSLLRPFTTSGARGADGVVEWTQNTVVGFLPRSSLAREFGAARLVATRAHLGNRKPPPRCRRTTSAMYRNTSTRRCPTWSSRRTVALLLDGPTRPRAIPSRWQGVLSIQDMGSRVTRDIAPKQKKSAMPDVQRGSLREGEDILQREQRKRQSAPRGAGILAAADLVEGLRYRPRTPATRATFELILSLVATNLGDVPNEVVRSAADAVLEYLKDDDLKDFDRKKEVDDIFGSSMSPKEFNELINLGKKITDYDAQDEDEDMADAGREEEEIDERQGVAVDFEDEDEGDGMIDEVRDESSEDEDGEDRPELEDEAEAGGAGEDRAEESAGLADGDAMVIDSAPAASEGRQAAKQSGDVAAREIDAYWLQRQIGKLYPDAHIQHDKTHQALRILSGESDEPGQEEKQLREIENDLMELFDYEHHEVVQRLIQNREKIVWLTKLSRAESDEERGALEREMASEGLRWILNELHGKRTDGAKGKMEIKMDIDAPVSLAEGQVPKAERPEGQLVGGLAPKKDDQLGESRFRTREPSHDQP